MAIRRSLACGLLVCAAAAAGCGGSRTAAPSQPPRATSPPVDGTLAVAGLSAPVTVVRDGAGIPHITASTPGDLFFAQGFVQAQDRLFQMDLWRRSVQGRLSEVLGANFIERDAMTRRFQYRGPLDVEWASYGADAQSIANAFTRGINAWIAQTGDQLPEMFALAGWKPERWTAADLLNRTDAFLASGNAQDEILRARLIAAVGVIRADAMWPAAAGRTVVAAGLDPAVINYTLGELLKRVGAPPYFAGFAAPFRSAPAQVSAVAAGSTDHNARIGPVRAADNAWALSGSLTASGAPVVAGEPHRALTSPAPRYLVHLRAPGWDVAGATAPWLPGVAIGHNADVAWTIAAAVADTQDIYVERLNPANERQVQDGDRWLDMRVEHDAIEVKGRTKPFEYDRLYTRHGVVVGLDRERHLAFTLRWSGTEPGAAGELAALALDRARSAADVRRALARWKMPVVDVVFADRGGDIGEQRAGLVPRRSAGMGRVPSAGWNRSGEWSGWETATAPARASRETVVVAANDSLARTSRLRELLTVSDREPAGHRLDVEANKHLQHDVHAWNADRLIPLLGRVRGRSAKSEEARGELLKWNREMTATLNGAAKYAAFESALARRLVARLPDELRSELSSRIPLVPAIVTPARTWFDGSVVGARDALLVDALEETSSASGGAADNAAWGVAHTITFTHPLGIHQPSRSRFNVGPFPMRGYAETVFALTPATGPALQVIFDAGAWDDSAVLNAPGQSEWPDSPHFADLAKAWGAGEYVPLPFSDAAVHAAAASTLTLVPGR